LLSKKRKMPDAARKEGMGREKKEQRDVVLEGYK